MPVSLCLRDFLVISAITHCTSIIEKAEGGSFFLLPARDQGGWVLGSQVAAHLCRKHQYFVDLGKDTALATLVEPDDTKGIFDALDAGHDGLVSLDEALKGRQILNFGVPVTRDLIHVCLATS